MSTLYNKYRPKNLNQMVGNENVKSTIKKMIDDKKPLPHSYLFTGGSGCGKTTLARILGKYFGATSNGIKDVNAADLTGIDNVREIIQQAQFPNPASPRASVYILDECHKLSNAAQNALLKILEEPPAHAYFILCTTDPDKIINTIQTRLTHFHLQSLTDEEMSDLLLYVCGEEGFNYDDQSLIEIINKCGGSPRQAMSLLQTCSGFLDSPSQVKKNLAGKGLFVADGDGDFETAKNLISLMEKGNWVAVGKELKDITSNGISKNVEQGVINLLGARLLWNGQSYDKIADIIMELNSPTDIYGHAIFYARMRLVFRLINKSKTTRNTGVR